MADKATEIVGCWNEVWLVEAVGWYVGYLWGGWLRIIAQTHVLRVPSGSVPFEMMEEVSVHWHILHLMLVYPLSDWYCDLSLVQVLRLCQFPRVWFHSSDRSFPHENALLPKLTCIASFWPTVHMDQTHFSENGSQGGEIRKRSPPVVVWTANPHTFQTDDAIAPPLNLWTLQCLITKQQRRTTCLCWGCRRYWAFLATFLPCSWVWVAAAVRPHDRSTQKILVSLHSPFSSSSCCVGFLRLLYVCKQQASLMCMLSVFFSVFGECQAPPIGWNMNYYYKSAVWAYSGYYKNARGQVGEDGSPICRSCKRKLLWGAATHPVYTTITLNCSVNAR